MFKTKKANEHTQGFTCAIINAESHTQARDKEKFSIETYFYLPR